MKAYLKIIVGLLIFIYVGKLSGSKALSDIYLYRDMATPKKMEEKVDYGPAITGSLVESEGPWAPAPAEERDEDFLMGELEKLLVARRITASDAYSSYSFVPTRCMKCHEKDGPGTFFYGNENFEEDQLFATKEGLVLRSWPLKGFAPTLKYDFLVTHAKKVPFEVGGTGEQILKIAQ